MILLFQKSFSKIIGVLDTLLGHTVKYPLYSFKIKIMLKSYPNKIFVNRSLDPTCNFSCGKSFLPSM